MELKFGNPKYDVRLKIRVFHPRSVSQRHVRVSGATQSVMLASNQALRGGRRCRWTSWHRICNYANKRRPERTANGRRREKGREPEAHNEFVRSRRRRTRRRWRRKRLRTKRARKGHQGVKERRWMKEDGEGWGGWGGRPRINRSLPYSLPPLGRLSPPSSPFAPSTTTADLHPLQLASSFRALYHLPPLPLLLFRQSPLFSSSVPSPRTILRLARSPQPSTAVAYLYRRGARVVTQAQTQTDTKLSSLLASLSSLPVFLA